MEQDDITYAKEIAIDRQQVNPRPLPAARGNRGRPGSPGCHKESEARMVKVIFLTSSAPPRRLK